MEYLFQVHTFAYFSKSHFNIILPAMARSCLEIFRLIYCAYFLILIILCLLCTFSNSFHNKSVILMWAVDIWFSDKCLFFPCICIQDFQVCICFTQQASNCIPIHMASKCIKSSLLGQGHTEFPHTLPDDRITFVRSTVKIDTIYNCCNMLLYCINSRTYFNACQWLTSKASVLMYE